MARRDPTLPGSDGGPAPSSAAREAVAVQEAEFGGVKWGAAFFGWL